MSLSIIAAVDQNGLIGQRGEIPWDLPADLKYFKETTLKSPVIMGRKTFESIGSPLPNRRNIIMSRDEDYSVQNCEVVNSKKKILNKFLETKKEAFIIGGAEIYQLFLPYSSKLYLTVIEHQFSGDTYFPEIKKQNWLKISKRKGKNDSSNPYLYYHYIYQRKNNTKEEYTCN